MLPLGSKWLSQVHVQFAAAWMKKFVVKENQSDRISLQNCDWAHPEDVEDQKDKGVWRGEHARSVAVSG